MSLVGCEEDHKEFTEVNSGIYLQLGQEYIDNQLDFVDATGINDLDFAELHISMEILVDKTGLDEANQMLGSS
ncbi:hypothetical protein [Vibrio sp. WXL210]|uniref:hypothetical protein n=1 Tax=Vibrio sp. WXL210 TaxID=3450709 RepID=UPI003EC77BC7